MSTDRVCGRCGAVDNNDDVYVYEGLCDPCSTAELRAAGHVCAEDDYFDGVRGCPACWRGVVLREAQTEAMRALDGLDTERRDLLCERVERAVRVTVGDELNAGVLLALIRNEGATQ